MSEITVGGGGIKISTGVTIKELSDRLMGHVNGGRGHYEIIVSANNDFTDISKFYRILDCNPEISLKHNKTGKYKDFLIIYPDKGEVIEKQL